MFPIRDHNPSGRVAYVTYGLIAANILIFLIYWLGITDEDTLDAFFMTYGLVPADITFGGARLPILSHMFLHGGWAHLLGNMLFLWIFGDNMEDILGHGRFALFYLASGLTAAFLQILPDPASAIPMVGASGAIAGVLGGYLLLYPRARVDVLCIFVIFFRIFPIPAWVVLGAWFGMQLLSTALQASDGVAYLAHIGGFLGGLALAVPIWRARGGRAFWAATSGAPPHPAALYRMGSSSIPRVPRR